MNIYTLPIKTQLNNKKASDFIRNAEVHITASGIFEIFSNSYVLCLSEGNNLILRNSDEAHLLKIKTKKDFEILLKMQTQRDFKQNEREGLIKN